MAKVSNGQIVSEGGEWLYSAAGFRPWTRIAAGNEPKPGVAETFRAAEMARQQRIERKKGN